MAIRTNYCTNPSFEIDTNADGLSDSWVLFNNCGTAPTLTRPAGRLGGYAQRLQFTSAGDTNKDMTLRIVSAVASFAAGEPATASFYVKGTLTGLTAGVYCASRKSDGSAISAVTINFPLTTASGWQRYSVTYPVLPALTSLVTCDLYIANINTGNTCDVTMDDALIEKSASPGDYFDGSYPRSQWLGVARASASISGIIVPVIGSPIVHGMRVE